MTKFFCGPMILSLTLRFSGVKAGNQRPEDRFNFNGFRGGNNAQENR
jgi:hypothetical protein